MDFQAAPATVELVDPRGWDMTHTEQPRPEGHGPFVQPLARAKVLAEAAGLLRRITQLAWDAVDMPLDLPVVVARQGTCKPACFDYLIRRCNGVSMEAALIALRAEDPQYTCETESASSGGPRFVCVLLAALPQLTDCFCR